MNVLTTMTFAAGLALGDQDVVIFDEKVQAPAVAGQKNVTFFSRTTHDVVKGAPYTAESVTEHVQVLPDGNRIAHSNKSNFARDSEGRTRRETTISGLGPVGQTETPVVSVFIEDPVAKFNYTLDSQRKVAMKQKYDGGLNFKIAGAAGAGYSTNLDHVVVERKMVAPARPGVVAGMEATMTMKARTSGELKKEDLGARNIEGVSAKGTRTVMVIPAGEVGNERPIEVVTETWYSDEIKAVVLTKHSDPRSGEMTNRLLNVRLGEPSKSLFEPPADYKVEEVSNMRMPMPTAIQRVKEDR